MSSIYVAASNMKCGGTCAKASPVPWRNLGKGLVCRQLVGGRLVGMVFALFEAWAFARGWQKADLEAWDSVQKVNAFLPADILGMTLDCPQDMEDDRDNERSAAPTVTPKPHMRRTPYMYTHPLSPTTGCVSHGFMCHQGKNKHHQRPMTYTIFSRPRQR